jgi:hypothetical protein
LTIVYLFDRDRLVMHRRSLPPRKPPATFRESVEEEATIEASMMLQ